jgi:hypothetical protein
VRCAECEIEAPPDARGWRGYRVDDPEDGDEPMIGHFCPACSEREFGRLPSGRRAEPGNGWS